jgi:hypothetical protein
MSLIGFESIPYGDTSMHSRTSDFPILRNFTFKRLKESKDDDIIGWRGGENGHVGIVASVYFNEKNRRWNFIKTHSIFRNEFGIDYLHFI